MNPQAGDEATTRGRTLGLLTAGAGAGPLFVGSFLLQPVFREGYDPLRHPVSSLALGPGGPAQVITFLVAGVGYLCLAAGLARLRSGVEGTRAAVVLVAVVGLGLVGAGAFVTDPVNGYPPGSPAQPVTYSTTGLLHDLFSMLVFAGLPALAGLLAVRFRGSGDRGWAAVSAATAVLMPVLFVVALLGFVQAPGLAGHAGLAQRASIVVGLGWLTALAVRARRQLPRTALA